MRISIQDAGTCDGLGMERGYAAIRQAGFDAIDWNIDHALPGPVIRNGNYRGKCIFEKPLEDVIAYYAEELAIIRKNGLAITQSHAPFPAYLPEDPALLDYMIGIYCRAIEFCDYAGCPRMVIHGISLSQSDSDNTLETVETLNWKLYSSLIPTLLKNNVTLCLENLCSWDNGVATEGICFDAHEAVAFIDKLNAEAGKEVFGLCMDVGHMQLVSKDIRTYAPILGDRIKCLHIHDNDAFSDRHAAPFTGSTNWNTVCAALKSIGYAGDLSFECVNSPRKVQRFDDDLVLPWLKVICATGKAFRKRILD